jgi:hypothetical protein
MGKPEVNPRRKKIAGNKNIRQRITERPNVNFGITAWTNANA